jgi:hypothetical protein
MRFAIFFVSFLCFVLTYQGSFASPLSLIKNEQIKIKAKHFSKLRNGIHGDTIFLYKDYKNKYIKYESTPNTRVLIFHTDIKLKRRRNSSLKVTKVLENVTICEKGYLGRYHKMISKPRNKKISSIRLDLNNQKIKNVVIYQRNLRVKVIRKHGGIRR